MFQASADLVSSFQGEGWPVEPSFPSFAAGQAQGFGLRGMQERVQALGGEFAIETGNGGGTCVRIVIPLPSPYPPPQAAQPANYGGTEFDSINSHPRVGAGLVPATRNFEAQGKNVRGGRDKPGDDARKSGPT